MDTISNFIIQLKNAGNAGLSTISVRQTKVVLAIAEVLAKHGYVKSITKATSKKENGSKMLEIEIAYVGDEPRIANVARVSKLSRRVYQGAKEIRRVRNGFGTTILTTPKGIMTDMEAKKAGVGGEVLFKIW